MWKTGVIKNNIEWFTLATLIWLVSKTLSAMTRTTQTFVWIDLSVKKSKIIVRGATIQTRKIKQYKIGFAAKACIKGWVKTFLAFIWTD